MAATDVTFSYVDESKENCRIMLSLPAILADGSNWDTVVSDVLSNLKVLGTGLQTLTRCNEYKSSVNVIVAKAEPTYPSDEFAQREIVARMTYADTVTGALYRFDIPGPESLFIAGTDEVDMDSAGMAAFKIVFDAKAVSPVGNAVSLLRGKRQGKRA
jgi:hypothetical protein